MKVGFTGTREGMTVTQSAAVLELLRRLQPTEGHHGDCVGADDEFARLLDQHFPDCKVVCHPPEKEEKRAFHYADETRQPFSYFRRDRNIVHEADVLIGAPVQGVARSIGGTWYTIGYAQKVGRPVYVVLPDGTVETQEGS